MRRDGRHSETRVRVEETTASFLHLELRAVLPELGEAQVSSSLLVLTGMSWGGAKKKRGGRKVGGEVREKERKKRRKRKEERERECPGLTSI